MVYLKQIRIDTGNDLFTKRYKDSLPMSSSFYSLLLNQNKYMSFGALMDNNVLDTIFTKMFFLKEYDEQFFQPVMQASPLLSLYRVKGDVYRKNE